MITGHGDDLYQYDGIRMNFSSNIYSHANLSGLKDYLKEHMDVIGSYPEPQPFTLEAMLAERHGIPQECVMVTNGATEAIYLIAQTFRNGVDLPPHTPRYIIHRPTFSEYEDAMNMYGYRMAEDKEDTEGDTLVWLCNPNNPTGEVKSIDNVRQMLDDRSRLYIIDQSYEDHTKARIMYPKEGIGYENLIQIHSMTKTYAVPGLRLGYITATKDLVGRIRKYQHPWSVNALAIVAGQYLLSHDTKAVADLDTYLAETHRLREALQHINGLETDNTETNFMLCRLQKGKAYDLKIWLAETQGILIRDASNFKGLDEHCFRIATQAPHENDLLVEAIANYIKRNRE